MQQIEFEYHDPLLEIVQVNRIFPDGKTFVDCIPKFPVEEIFKKYFEEKKSKDFDLKIFVLDNYDLPLPVSGNYKSDTTKPVTENIEALWQELTREPEETGGSIIKLPFPYIVPGGRFAEIYYWDSYFTMLGLQVSGRIDMIENMINNFSYLINQFGYIPNGNRNYFLGRSQPPFYSLMIKLLAAEKGDEILAKYFNQLKQEYSFWMKGADKVNAANKTYDRVVLMPDGELLNRYWDEHNTPRPESFREDVELSLDTDEAEIFRHLRAGAESGWDFSSRWFGNKKLFTSIHTTDIIPVDLNCLLVHLEETLAMACSYNNADTEAEHYQQAAKKRKAAIQKYCWNEEQGFYFDYDFTLIKQKEIFSLAAAYPLFFTISTKEQAAKIADIINQKFLHNGGLISTLETTGQQWDAPNGWAPLHWITITGFENYGHGELASTIAKRWINLCTTVFKRTGKLMEKYNVVDTALEAGGGEYAGQDGFGWTNGVLLALRKKYKA